MSSESKKQGTEGPQENFKTQVQGQHSWYEQQLASGQAINIAKFKGNLQDAVNFYYKEVNKLYFANTILNNQLRLAVEEKKKLADQIIALEREQKNSNEQRKKRYRRCASQIVRRCVCPVKSCEKSYGSQGSLAQHMRLKHPDVGDTPNKTDEKQPKMQEKYLEQP